MNHDDFGGLDRDLAATGAALKRRDVLRLALSAGMFHLLGCGDSSGPSGSGACIEAVSIPLSLYSSGATNQNYLRGVQAAGANGQVSFTTIFPGCYAGRWPHIHFEVYQSLAAATAVGTKIAISRLALLKVVCDRVYATTGYSASVNNLAGVSLATDNVFSDGSANQLATMSGDVTAGFLATLTVPV